jgi:ParB-like chromosome segregation protein Spo0J
VKKPKLRTLRLSQLAPAEWRARGMTQLVLEGFRKSLELFGPARLPVWNARSGELVDGVELVKALIDDGETKTRAIVVDLAEGEAKALHIALNSDAFKGDWTDLDAFEELLEAAGKAAPEIAQAVRDRLACELTALQHRAGQLTPLAERPGQRLLF